MVRTRNLFCPEKGWGHMFNTRYKHYFLPVLPQSYSLPGHGTSFVGVPVRARGCLWTNNPTETPCEKLTRPTGTEAWRAKILKDKCSGARNPLRPTGTPYDALPHISEYHWSHLDRPGADSEFMSRPQGHPKNIKQFSETAQLSDSATSILKIAVCLS